MLAARLWRDAKWSNPYDGLMGYSGKPRTQQYHAPRSRPHRVVAGAPRASGVARGVTLLELLMVLTLIGILGAVALAGWHRLADRRAVRGGRAGLIAAFTTARRAAISRTEPVAVRLDPVRGRAVVHAAANTLAVHPLGATFYLRLASTRDSMAYDATGLGVGAANLTAILSRGAAAETVVVARLGRVR